MRRLFTIALCLLLILLPGCSDKTKSPANDIPDNHIEVSAPADEEAISLALQSLRELGGGTLTLSEGVFIIDGSINLISNMILQGQGENTVIKIKDGHNQSVSMIYGNGVSNVTIRDLVIDGNKDNQTAGLQYGIQLDNSSKITIENITVQKCRNEGLFLNICQDSRVSRCNMLNNNPGIAVYGDSKNLIIVENIINANTSSLFLGCTNTTVSLNTIFENNSSGIGLRLGGDNNITNNTIYKNGNHGILLDGAWRNNILGNNIFENGQNANDTYGNIYIQRYTDAGGIGSDGNNIQNNICRRGALSNKPKYGIYLGGNNDRNLISNNDCYTGGVTYGIYIDASATNTSLGAGNRNNNGAWSTTPN